MSQRLPISCLENVISNAERRGLTCNESVIVPRVSDIYASLPSITGKFELEYEGELRGGERVARDLIRAAVARIYDRYFKDADTSQIVQWFELGGTLKVTDGEPARNVVEQLGQIQGLLELAAAAVGDRADDPEAVASVGEFLLDGLYAYRRISRNEELGYVAQEKKRDPAERKPVPAGTPRQQYN